MSSDPPVFGIRPILTVVHPNGERLIVARLTSLGAFHTSHPLVPLSPRFRHTVGASAEGTVGCAGAAPRHCGQPWRRCAT
ncbi:hypothetical protein GAY28_07010, partial [Azospirillum brasilense]|nr:hypothetical protein [Azospirillum brasilense]